MKKKKGISLIVLIITIVVIIVLAAAVILTINKNNPIESAKEAKFKNDLSNLSSNVVSSLSKEYINNQNISKILISEPKVYEYLPEAQGKYKICIDHGVLAINESDYTEQELKWAQEINIKIRSSNQIDSVELTATTNSITAKINKSQIKDGDIYKYQIIGIGAVTDWIEDTTSHEFVNLKSGTEYVINCKVVSRGIESDVVSQSIKTEGISGETKIVLAPQETWLISVTATITHDNMPIEGYKIEYKIGTEDWKEYKEPITIVDNTKLVARIYNKLSDDEVGGNSIDITNIDKLVPEEAKYTILGNNRVKVELSDLQSGIDIQKCKWKVGTADSLIPPDSTTWNSAKTFTSQEETIDVSGSIGINYLHVLIVDKAGNKKISVNEVIVSPPVPEDGIIYTDADGKQVPIPNGFVVSTVDGENTVKKGLVIKQGNDGAAKDTDVNEFVWVPANADSMYDISTQRGKLYDFDNLGGITALRNDCLTTASSYREPKQNTPTYQEDLNSMIASVRKYNGFYVGRYETGNLSQGTVVIKKMNADVSNQTFNNCYTKLKSMISNKYVQTGIIWGCQWDMTLNMLKFYSYGSKGNFRDQPITYIDTTGATKTKADGTALKIPTGSSDYTKVMNIYDLGGNVKEYTMEVYSTSSNTTRGGSYSQNYYATNYTAAWTRAYNTGSNEVYTGVRAQMYIK